MDSESMNKERETRSFLRARDPSVDRRERPRPNKKLRLFDDIQELENSSEGSDAESEDYVSNSDSTSSKQTVEVESGPQVFLRLRPVDVQSVAYSISECGTKFIIGGALENSSNNVTVNKCNIEKHFTFSSIFDCEVGQSHIYRECVGNKIEEEESVTILAYGTSGSGKTYTLLGDDVRAGVIPRALLHIFTMYKNNLYPFPNMKLVNGQISILEDNVANKELAVRQDILSQCPDIQMHYQRLQQVINGDHEFATKEGLDVSVMIWVSFVEIYNELVYDLLYKPKQQANMAKPARKNLKILCNKGEVFVKGLTSVFVKSAEDALKLLRYGQQHLTYGTTAVNANSSRSHCVFFVDILKFYRSGITTRSSYKFCDLAGSERFSKTGATGARLKEAQRINTSLMVLGRCLDAASSTRKNSDVIPFRESKLTTLLQSALLGKERLIMIVTATPSTNYHEENLNALGFGSIAKNIIFKQPIVKQRRISYSGFRSFGLESRTTIELVKENEDLHAENNALRLEIEHLKHQHLLQMQLQEEKLRKEITDTFEEEMKLNIKQWEDRCERKLKMQERLFEANMGSQKRSYEEQIEDLRDEIDELKGINSVIELADDDSEN